MQYLWTWVCEHPIETVAIAMYLVANLAPRPANPTGWRAFVWGTIDRLCFLTRDRVPGNFKALFGPSPAPEPPPDPPRTADDE